MRILYSEFDLQLFVPVICVRLNILRFQQILIINLISSISLNPWTLEQNNGCYQEIFRKALEQVTFIEAVLGQIRIHIHYNLGLPYNWNDHRIFLRQNLGE